jgi:hypothetical protein
MPPFALRLSSVRTLAPALLCYPTGNDSVDIVETEK